jgi:exoribonuclease R
VHAGVAAPYAHVTAPLRRLADRYANEIVLARCRGVEPPDWAADALDRLVLTMEAANRLDADVERAVVDAVECVVLTGHIGERFEATVVDQTRTGVTVQLARAAIVAHMDADLGLGHRIQVVVAAVDPVARRVELTPAPRAHDGRTRKEAAG